MSKAKFLPAGEPDAVKRFKIGASEVEVGRFTYGHDTLTIKQWREGAALRIGAFCSIAHECQIMLGGNHRVDWGTTFPFGHIFQEELGGDGIVGHPSTRGDVVIGNDVWIGRNSTILSGVTIGDGAVVATGSVVTRSIGDYEIWGGNPAKLIRPRFAPEIIARFQALRWWEAETPVLRALAPLLSQPPTEAVLDEIAAALQGGSPAEGAP